MRLDFLRSNSDDHLMDNCQIEIEKREIRAKEPNRDETHPDRLERSKVNALAANHRSGLLVFLGCC